MGASFKDLEYQDKVRNSTTPGLAETYKGIQKDNERKDVIKSASAKWMAGDLKGALGDLAAIDPSVISGPAEKLMTVLNPDVQGKVKEAEKTGELSAQTDYGSNPRQLLDASIAGGKFNDKNKPIIRKSDRSPSGFSTFQNGKEIFIDAAGTPIGQGPDDSEHSMPVKPNLAIGQDVDSSGQIITLSPAQQKAIKDTRKSFDSETKEIVKGMNDAYQAVKMIDENVPGSQAVEKLRLLRSITPRINQQEFQAYGKGQGVATMIENAMSEAAGQGMSAQTQQNMKAITQITLKNLSDEYDTALKNHVEKTPEVDALILKKRLASSGPTVYQGIAKKVEQLPPQDQAAFNWAHDNASDPRAKAILKNLGF